jgi:hypothetical protein
MTRFIPRRGAALVAAAAIAAGLAGVGTATAASLIGSGDVANNSLKSKDIRDGTLKRKDLAKGVRTKLDAAGTPGPAGPAGPVGAAGAAGAPGLAQVELVTALEPASGVNKQAEVECPAGKTAISAGAHIGQPSPQRGWLKSVRVSADMSGAIAAADDNPADDAAWSLTVSAVCAKVG